MYEVALCEDEKIFAEEQEKICRSIFNKLNIEYHLTVFNGSKDFLDNFTKKHKRYDLILLDIIMDGTDGIEIARIIRSFDNDAVIIFITASSEYALQGYDVKALHYLMKPVDAGVLERLITSAYNEKFQNDFFVFKSGSQFMRIPINDIIALETVGRRVKITLPDMTHYCSGKLTELLAGLPKERFVRCHQSFVVNIGNIRTLTRLAAVTVNGKEIPISRAYMKDFKDAFLRSMQDV